MVKLVQPLSFFCVCQISSTGNRDQALMLLTLAEIKLNFPENDASVDAQLGWRLQEVTLEVGG